MPKKLSMTKVATKPTRGVASLLEDVRQLILAAREQVARASVSELGRQLSRRARLSDGARLCPQDQPQHPQ